MRLFIKEKPVRALIAIRRGDEVYASEVAEQIDTTYSHTVKIVTRLKENNLVNSEKKGRKKVLDLSDKGTRYADLFIEIIELGDQPMIDLEAQSSINSDSWRTKSKTK